MVNILLFYFSCFSLFLPVGKKNQVTGHVINPREHEKELLRLAWQTFLSKPAVTELGYVTKSYTTPGYCC